MNDAELSQNSEGASSLPEASQKRSAKTRDRLIEASIEIFSQRGFKAATTRDIVQAAGVALASVPYYFKTKEQLWKAAVDRIYQDFNERLVDRRRRFPEQDSRAQSRAQLREFILFTAGKPEFIRLLLHEGTSESERLVWFVETHFRPQFEYVKEEVEKAQEDGYGRLGRADHLFFMIIGSVGLLYAVEPAFNLLTGESPTGEDMLTAHVDSILELFYPSEELASRPT
jgi:TetR/AcrR family transcriptional regulator